MTSKAIVQKLWNYCNVLRDALSSQKTFLSLMSSPARLQKTLKRHWGNSGLLPKIWEKNKLAADFFFKKSIFDDMFYLTGMIK